MAFPTVSSQKPVTHRAYFEGGHLGQSRQELIDGVLHTLLAVDRNHLVILDNLIQCLTPQMRHSPWCEMVQNVMVGNGPTPDHTPSGQFSYSTEGAFLRPDVVLMAEPKDYFVPSQVVLRNPSAIVEVVSAEEEPYVTGIRFEGLRRWLDHRCTDYVLISTARAAVAHYRRRSVHDWPLTVHTGSGEVVSLPRVGVTVTLGELYRGVRDRAGRPFVGAVCLHCGRNVF